MRRHDAFFQSNKAWDEGRLCEAFELFRIAAHGGDPSAQNTLAYFYDHGIGTNKQPDKAVTLYRRAARHGDMCACANLGIIYRDKGAFRWAKFWFKRAIERGDADSALELARLYLAKGVDVASAEKLLKYVINTRYIEKDRKNEARKLLRRLGERKSR